MRPYAAMRLTVYIVMRVTSRIGRKWLERN